LPADPVAKSGAETQPVIAPIDSAARLASGASRRFAPSQPAPSLPAPPAQDLPALGSTSSFVFLLFGFLAALAFFSAPARSSFTRRSQAGAGATQRFALLLERPG